MKTLDIVKVYKTINDAKLTKMEDADKFLVIKAIRVLRPIATNFEEYVKEAQEKLKDDKFSEMQKKAQKWNEEGTNCAFTNAEKLEINAYFQAYNKKVDDCVKQESELEHSLDYERLSEEAFGKFIASNDYKVNTIVELEDALLK